MPALKAFGRRWNIGSDDLVLPGFMELAIRGTWFVVLLVFFVMHMDEPTCDNEYAIQLFYIGTLTILASQIILCIAMTTLSSRGTMAIKSPRRHMALVIYIRLAVFIPEMAWMLLGLAWMFKTHSGCDKTLLRAGKGIVLAELIFLVIMALSLWFVFDSLGRRHRRRLSTKDHKRLWHERCRALSCCIPGDENSNGAFEDIADMLTKLFKNRDIVVTDIIAGLVVLYVRSLAELKDPSIRYHQVQPKSDDSAQNGTPATNDTSQPPTAFTGDKDTSQPPTAFTGDKDTSQPPTAFTGDKEETRERKDWMTLENASYYCKYAVGSYASYNYVRCRNCDQRCGLCCKYRCLCQPRRFSPARLEGDNSCECQMAAVLQYTSINPDDIMFANFENQIYETPYFVALDESRKSVVVAIRGTKTFQDAITDLTAYGECLEEEGVTTGMVHGGMLKVARNIYQQLQEIHLLDKIPADYNLVVTGHSLGGGAAVLLSIMLKNRFPDIKCFAYSPPGGLVSSWTISDTEEFVCSVVLGNDIVPRLSLHSMERLKRRVLDAIKSCTLPKYKIFASGVLAVCFGCKTGINHHSIMERNPSKSSLLDLSEESSNDGIGMSHGMIKNHGNSQATCEVKVINTTGCEENISNNDAVLNADDVNNYAIHILNADDVNNDAINMLNADDVNNDAINILNADDVNNDAITILNADDVNNGAINMETAVITQSVRPNENGDVENPISRKDIRRHTETDIESQIRPTTFQVFQKSHMRWKKGREDRLTGLLCSSPLYLPGHVLYLEEEPAAPHSTKPCYCVRWLHPREFEEIVVSPNMLNHHHGYVMARVLQKVIAGKQYDSKTLETTSIVHTTQPVGSNMTS